MAELYFCFMNARVQYYKNFIGTEIKNGPSPFANWLNGIIREVEEESISIEFTVRPEMCNPVKWLHGGMIAAIIDDVIGMNIWLIDDAVFYFTVGMHVDYYANVQQGNKVTATTRIVKKGKRVMYASCSLTSAEGILLARGNSTLIPSE